MSVTSTATDITLVSNTFSATYATVWVSGGTIPNYYTITNTITTVGGRTRARSIRIMVANQ
jgi:hypothetical protein